MTHLHYAAKAQRRVLIPVVLVTLVATTLTFTLIHMTSPRVKAASPHVTIGMMRWDVGVPGGGGYAPALSALQPHQWEALGYWPFFATKDGNGNLTALNDSSPSIMAQENQYAANDGVDYWAFYVYPTVDGSGSNYASIMPQWSAYMQSSNKGLIKFSFILASQFCNAPSQTTDYNTMVTAMHDGQYQTVLNGRPLVFLFQVSDAQCISTLRNTITAGGVSNPYIVDYDRSGYGEDASSAYSPGVSTGANGNPYSDLENYAQNQWAGGIQSNANYVPNAPFNWDDRPWVQTPPPWWSNPDTSWYTEPTQDQYRQMLQNGVNFVLAHSDKSPAMTIVSKEWGSAQEGGAVAPSTTKGTTFVDAIKLVNKSGTSSSTNLVQNPGFETGNLSNWTVWPGASGNDGNAAYVEAGGHTGSYRLAEWKGSSYQVSVYQALSNIPNGNYQASAWVQSSGGQTYAQMRILDHPGGTVLPNGTVDIPTTSTWTLISTTVDVTNGQANIEFDSQAPANDWIRVDDVSFVQSS